MPLASMAMLFQRRTLSSSDDSPSPTFRFFGAVLLVSEITSGRGPRYSLAVTEDLLTVLAVSSANPFSEMSVLHKHAQRTAARKTACIMWVTPIRKLQD